MSFQQESILIYTSHDRHLGDKQLVYCLNPTLPKLQIVTGQT